MTGRLIAWETLVENDQPTLYLTAEIEKITVFKEKHVDTQKKAFYIMHIIS